MLRRMRTDEPLAVSVLVSSALAAAVALGGCATAYREDRDAGRRVDAPVVPFDTGPRADVPAVGIDVGPLSDPDGGSPLDPDGGPVVPPDAGPPGVDGGPPPVDAGPRPDAPGDPCAGVSCAVFDGPCSTGVCQASTGACLLVPRADGLGCDDGDPCTTGDACLAGACRRGTDRDCSAMTSACAVGSCDPATGTCRATPLADGTACGGGGCGGGTCSGGACTTTGVPDCTSCGSAMYCAAGACGANPTTLTYGFESGALPAGWTNGVGGTTGWVVVAGGAYGGTYRARSGAIGHSAQSRLSFTITLASAASLSFWFQTSTESCCDFLEVLVDGVVSGSWAGTYGWTQATVALAAGTRTIELRYRKDGSVVAGSDSVTVDDLTIGPPAPLSTGFEGATLPAGYTSAGSASWFTDTTMPRSGARAAASGTISHSASTSMTTTVTLTSASSLTYWYRVSSESGFDYLRTYIDGAMAGQWSGTVAWTMASHALSAGTHVIEWRYSKDSSVSSGSDRAWIDDVDFGVVPVGGPLCGP